jgi:hypothetical protein
MRTANIGIGVGPLMSAFGGKADIAPTSQNVRSYPKRTPAGETTGSVQGSPGVSFDLSGDRESS